jgi:hypothetical protein
MTPPPMARDTMVRGGIALTPAMAATEMAPIRSPGLIRRAKARVPHSGTDCEGRCWISSGAPSSHTSLY